MRRSTHLLATLAVFCALLTSGRAALDISPADGLPDIWAYVHNVGSVPPAGDEDGDGQTNAAEAIAGTNPKSAGDSIKIKSFAKSGGSVTLVFPAIGGKKYEIESSPSLAGGGFAGLVPASIHQPSVDGDITVTVPSGSATFFRVVVSDLDTDGDGLTDYEERMLGLNPNLADSNGDGTSDYAYVTGQLALPETVSVRAVQTFASEDGPSAGTFEVFRSRSLFSVTVPYGVSGTATPSTDYVALSGSVTLAQGAASATISVNPNAEAPNVVESGESVTVTLAPPPPEISHPYALGTPSTATVIISETATANGTGLLARYYNTASTNYVDAANFGQAGTYVFTRGSPTTTGSVVVSYTTGNLSALQVGHTVKLSFTSGSTSGVRNATFNHQNYAVTAVTASTFTVSVTAPSAFTVASSSGDCNLSVQSFPHPAASTRVDPTVDFVWLYGTPNGTVIFPGNSADNYSAAWDGYLHPTTAGSYIFQLDADDKARVLLDTGSGLQQILEHGWDGPATIGTFKQSAPITLAVPANPGQRYHIRVEHVETTGDARCRLQWSVNGGAFANIPQAQVFTHTSAMSANYNYTRSNSTPGAMSGTIVVTLNGHTFNSTTNNSAQLFFSSGSLFAPSNGNFHGPYTVTAFTATTFTVAIAGATLPASGGGTGFVASQPNSTTTGLFNLCYANTAFSGAPGRVGVEGSVTFRNGGIWGTGAPDPTVIPSDVFSVRWTGQVQPQFSEDYTFVLNADDSVKLWINGQPQTLRLATNDNSPNNYSYNDVTGQAVLTLTATILPVFNVGDKLNADFSSGPLSALGYVVYEVVAVSGTNVTVNVDVSGLVPVPAAGTGLVSIDTTNYVVDWPANGSADRYVRIAMQGGVRYDIQLDYFENTLDANCQLSWYSASQPKQIIPSNRLYPSSTPSSPLAPPILTSPTAAVALVGGPFSYAVAGSNGANVTVSGNPAWLTYSGGVLSGTPPAGAAGFYQVIVTTTGPAGTGTSVINLAVQDTGATIAREFWNGVAGTTVASIPTSTAPSGTSSLSQLAAPTDFGDDYGARIRGYITVPETGNYYFWIAANNAAELWIANDNEPVNALKRAWVTTGTAAQEWNNAGETNQKSPWIALEAGHKYYIEILHKAGTGAGDNLAVGWLKPGQTGTAPSEVVPGYALSPYVAPAPGSTPGTLYFATMLSQGGAVTNGVGTSTLRLNENETIATMRFTASGLTGEITQKHIHVDSYLSKPTAIVFDIDTPVTPGDGLQPDGSYKWTILDVSPYSAAEIREIIKQGKAYINLHTALYPSGEIRGNYTLANGTRTFTPPPAPPAYPDDHATNEGAVRFLSQATFGGNTGDIATLKAMAGYDAWIEAEFAKPVSYTLPEVLRTELAGDSGGAFNTLLLFNAWWRNAVSAPDQLRQRVAFALSEIHVVSATGPLGGHGDALAYFYDMLLDHAFGNFRDLLEATTLTPAMGLYLDMKANDKPDLSIGRIPNENYAREIMQLFSIGLFRQWPDGTLILNSKDELIDTYTQREIVGLSHVFTGWDDGYDGAYKTTLSPTVDYLRPMREVPARHFTGEKRLLNNEVLPGLTTAGGQPLDPYSNHSATQNKDPNYQALARQELDAAHEQLFQHPNAGPFICRQLIQRLVTSHPSRDYLYRVVQKFNDNGAGVRGDLKAVVKAILLDYEARSTEQITKPAYGKQREPVLRVAVAGRAFRPAIFSGNYSQNGSNQITIETTTPHLLQTDNNVFLEFATGSPLPFIGSYSATVVDADTFRVNAPGWMTGTYSKPASSSTVTVTIGNHWLAAGHKAYFDFTSGGLNGVAGIDNTVHTVATSSGETSSTFTITVAGAPSAAITNETVMIPRFVPGSYRITDSGLAAPNDKRITLSTDTDHNLAVGNQVQLNFYTGNPQPPDLVGTVESVVDLNTYTVLTTTGLANESLPRGVYQFPLLSQPLVRSGNVSSRPGTFLLNGTDADIDQTPMNSPTVFNFYLPDFKFPGALASQGITTPEFQETVETSVIRQANFFERGIYGSANTNGITSFRAGSNAVILDLSPWMGLASNTAGTPGAVLGPGPQPTQAWTSNANLSTLIDRLTTLLMAGQMSAAGKSEIQTFVSNTANIPYNNTTPSDVNKRDRVRGIVHFLLTSPDFIIQR